MHIPDQYKTGNKGMDDKIAKALAKGAWQGKAPVIDNPFNNNEPYNKYNVRPIEERTYHDGTKFASKSEMLRWDYLLNLQKAGQITDLVSQPVFILQEGYISKQKEWGDMKPLKYVADFQYTNISFRKGYEGRECVEDSKTGELTKEYVIKRKLFLYKYGSLLFFEV